MLNRIAGGAIQQRVRGRLFHKYVAVLIIVCTVISAFVVFEIWAFYQDRKTSIVRIEQEQAGLAAANISDFVTEIEDQLRWTTHRPWTSPAFDQQRLELWRLLLHEVPAITDAALLTSAGLEELRVSRHSLDKIGGGADFSKDPKFIEAVKHGVYYSPVYFRSESEPYMTIALAGTGAAPTVSMAEVNLKFIWDTVSQIKVGESGYIYVIDQQGRLIAHPNITLVLRDINFSHLTHVHIAQAAGTSASTFQKLDNASLDYNGRSVLAAYALIERLGWLVFVEIPTTEAFAPLYASIARAIALLSVGALIALLVGLFLTRGIVRPLVRLEKFAATVRSTRDYNLRFNNNSTDEIGQLAGEFNDMLAELAASHDREIADHHELARAERLAAIGAMTASIAHEINQPLGAMVTHANAAIRWMERTVPNFNEAQKHLRSIAHDGQRASDVIKGIRAMFKADEQTRVSVNLNNLILEVLERAHGELNRRKVILKRELDNMLPPMIASRVQLQQVIFNLVMNAVDAMEFDRRSRSHSTSQIRIRW